MNGLTSLSTTVSLVLILGGLTSIIFPIAPSLPLVWLGVFIYAAAHQYTDISQSFMALISAIAFSTIILDYFLSRGGVKKLQAGPWGILGAVIGGAIGTFFGPLGTYLGGPVIGALVLETFRGRDRVYSYQSGNYTVVAFMGGTVIKLVASIAIIGLFILRLQHKL
jgi:uncharacterized protein YqgC (DUF456 family)